MRTILLDYHQVGERLWGRFNASRDKVVAYYGSLAATFSTLRPGPLATELAGAVTELERMVGEAASAASSSPKNQGM